MAYGARLESGLGASPQGFKSPILRASGTAPCGVPFCLPHRFEAGIGWLNAERKVQAVSIRRRLSYIALASAFVLGTAVAPAMAEKSITAGSSRGKINIYISNSKTAGVCNYKMSGSNLAGEQHIFIGSSWNVGTAYDLIGYINGDGSISNYQFALPTYKYNRNYRITLFKWDFWSIQDLDGNPAAISVSNNCS